MSATAIPSSPDRDRAGLPWHVYLLLCLAGAVGSFAMEPYAIFPAMAVPLTAIAAALDLIHSRRGDFSFGRRMKAAALVGWCAGFGYFVGGLWWLGKAFLVEADQFAWAMPFGVLGLPAVLAFFFAAGCMLACALWSDGWPRIFALAFGLSLAEWLRGHLFTGFPWNTLGMTLGNHLWFMQVASVIGLYGLTVLTSLIFTTPLGFALPRSWLARSGRSRDWRPGIAAILALTAIAAYGKYRIPSGDQPSLPVWFELMQPNVPQDDNFNAANGEAILDRYIELSAARREPGVEYKDPPPNLYIWPESAFPFLLHRNLDALDKIAAMLSANHAWLITGAARMEAPLPGEEAGRYYNSVQAVDENGIIRDTYDKVHLVPFGEYEPDFAKTLLRMTGLRQFVSIPGGFTPAARRKPFSVPGLPPIAVNICYEAIFSGAVLPESGPRPGLIVNVTNDAWFGDSPGPYQHFAQARLRTVEEGLPMIRAANSGISGAIDPYGRVMFASSLDMAGHYGRAVPTALDEPTPFSRWRHWPFALMLVCCGAIALLGRRYGKQS